MQERPWKPRSPRYGYEERISRARLGTAHYQWHSCHIIIYLTKGEARKHNFSQSNHHLLASSYPSHQSCAEASRIHSQKERNSETVSLPLAQHQVCSFHVRAGALRSFFSGPLTYRMPIFTRNDSIFLSQITITELDLNSLGSTFQRFR